MGDRKWNNKERCGGDLLNSNGTCAGARTCTTNGEGLSPTWGIPGGFVWRTTSILTTKNIILIFIQPTRPHLYIWGTSVFSCPFFHPVFVFYLLQAYFVSHFQRFTPFNQTVFSKNYWLFCLYVWIIHNSNLRTVCFVCVFTFNVRLYVFRKCANADTDPTSSDIADDITQLEGYGGLRLACGLNWQCNSTGHRNDLGPRATYECGKLKPA